MPQQTHFADSYLQAREKFVAAATRAGAEVYTFTNDRARGPAGEELRTDVARIGPTAPDAVIVLVSGTHGIEGFGGSGCQVGFLRESILAQAPPGTAALLVHALNPYGFAFQRRVNEDNVDLNRNFVDHADPPHNDAYDALHRALVPGSWSGQPRELADRFLREVATAQGLRYLQSAVTRGQYRHADGIFYGGVEPVWSHRLLDNVLGDLLPDCARVSYIDLHTGLGPWGAGEPIFRGGRDAGAIERARSWYGPSLTLSEDGTSSSTPIIGNTATLLTRRLRPEQQLTAITLEFGTLSGSEVLTALRADNWLHLQPEPASDVKGEIARQIRAAFYPSEPAWRTNVWERAKEIFGYTFAGLAAG